METDFFTKVEFIAAGRSGSVYDIGQGRALKFYHEEGEDMENEQRVFARLGSHPHIVQYLGSAGSKGIIMELGQSLSKYNRKSGHDRISLEKKVLWLRQAALGLEHLHSSGVIHGDVGCGNLILVDGCVKMIDFEGCGIDGCEPTATYKWFSRRDKATPDRKSDIFAYGCLVYELLTRRYPHYDLDKSENRSQEIQGRYRRGIFPDVQHLPLQDLMLGCWRGSFETMGDIITWLEEEEKNLEMNTTEALSEL